MFGQDSLWKSGSIWTQWGEEALKTTTLGGSWAWCVCQGRRDSMKPQADQVIPKIEGELGLVQMSCEFTVCVRRGVA